ncbi:MAG: DUF4253 domain-containing protein, partial [Acidimicrobiales bacterium]|nr:DUF4253 domain-containing protein [Acidimicrobiales bacterium]
VIDDPHQLARLLNGTVLAGRAIESVMIEGSDDRALAIRSLPGNQLVEWQTARELLRLTGRWPVIASLADLDVHTLFSRSPYAWGFDVDTSQARIVTRSEVLDTRDALAARRVLHRHVSVASLVDREVGATELAIGRRPSDAELTEELGVGITPRPWVRKERSPTIGEVDAWFNEWAGQDHPRLASLDPGYLDGFVPYNGWLVFLPTASWWNTPAYLSFFGAEGPGGAECLIAVLRSWARRYEAELVAHHGTWLQFHVGSPPRSISDALVLAREQHIMAVDTLSRAGVPVWYHARVLVGRPTWILHERP